MTAQEIVAAREAGQLDELLRAEARDEAVEAAPPPLRMAPRPDPASEEQQHEGGQLSREDLQKMSAEEIMRADREGRLDDLRRNARES